MFKAEDIMCKKVISVRADTNIYEAMNIMLENKISGLPVVDGCTQLMGIISEKDILRILVEGEVSADKKVADYMKHDVISFHPQDSIVDICEFLMKNPYRRVPIIDRGRIVGIIARRDIIHLILKLKSKGKSG